MQLRSHEPAAPQTHQTVTQAEQCADQWNVGVVRCDAAHIVKFLCVTRILFGANSPERVCPEAACVSQRQSILVHIQHACTLLEAEIKHATLSSN